MSRSYRACHLVVAGLLLAGCTGDAGPAGPPGTKGDPGDPGDPADDRGDIAGSVIDGSGAAVADATIVSIPATTTVTTDGNGDFALVDVPVGAYAIIVSKAGYSETTVNGVGVAAGATTSVDVTLAVVPPTVAAIAGSVRDAAGGPIAGATVSVKGTSVTTTTDGGGEFTLADVAPGFVYVEATAAGFLAGETRRGVYAAAGATSAGVAIVLSSRPSDTATYVGTDMCAMCHASHAALEAGSAHARSITADRSRMLHRSDAPLPLWPAVGGTVNPGVNAVSPVDGTTTVAVYLCQNTDGNYAMKFGGTADCLIADGVIVPVSGTYGGEGHGGIDSWNDNGQIDPDELNFGVYKQRFLARLADVPNASSWSYTTGKDKDFLILPVQITQSGGSTPTWGGYHGNDWARRSRTFSRKCAGCHNTGLDVAWDSSNLITSYDYADLNIGCEVCHGPGSEHVAEPAATKKLKIITPRNLTANGEVELCGMCHAADAGSSVDPAGAFGYPWNAANAGLLGGGNFVPGVYAAASYVRGYGTSTEEGGGFASWPDLTHGKAHRQQVPMFQVSMHANNPYQQLTCTSCHDPHTLFQGPREFATTSGSDQLTFETPRVRNNTLCLACHATHGPFAALSKTQVAALHVGEGGAAAKNDVPFTFTTTEVTAARGAVAAAVGEHMQEEASMGLAFYDPLDEAMPVGRCTSCHMPKTAKSGGWAFGLDGNGDTALVAGDQGSHTFAVIWPWQSAALKSASSVDTDIMPNSCGGCHPGSRISGD